MNFRGMSMESLLEIGAALFGALLLGGLAVLCGSRVAGGIVRARRRMAPPPSPGEVPPSRHEGISHVAAR